MFVFLKVTLQQLPSVPVGGPLRNLATKLGKQKNTNLLQIMNS